MNKRTLSSELLAGARYLKRRTVQKNVVKIQMITRALIEKISDEMGIRLDDDYDFFENLSNHLASILSDQTFYPENPLIDEILEMNPNVLDAVHKNQHVIVACHGGIGGGTICPLSPSFAAPVADHAGCGMQ